MFQTSELKENQLFDGNVFKGLVFYNPKVSYLVNTARPFIRAPRRIVESIYAHINEGKDLELRRKNAIEYQELYTLWQKIAEAKQNNDLNLNSYYDDLVYRLYLKGYRSE